MTQMLRSLFLVFVLVFGSRALYAQTADTTQPAKPKPKGSYKFGVFGNIQSGATVASFGGLKKDLEKKDALLNGFNAPIGGGAYFGGAITGMIFKRVILGLSAQGFFYHTAENTDTTGAGGQCRINSNLFTGYVGYAIINRNRWLLYPYLGFGGGNIDMFLKNYGQNRIYFGDNSRPGDPASVRDSINGINRLGTRTFKANHFDMEIGVSTRFMLKDRGHVMLGVDLGGYFRVAGDGWKNDQGTTISNVSPVNVSGGYLRFTLGGGIFWWAPGATPTKGNSSSLLLPKREKKEKKEKKPKEEKPVEGSN